MQEFVRGKLRAFNEAIEMSEAARRDREGLKALKAKTNNKARIRGFQETSESTHT
jgi:hypothetical protein